MKEIPEPLYATLEGGEEREKILAVKSIFE
jgi:hypothetical protein